MHYGYIRVSTETQAEKGYGLAAQRAAIEQYAADHSLGTVQIFQDAGISGNIKDTEDDDAIKKRTGLMDLVDALKPGDTVIVLNTSRLWRSDMTRAIVKRLLLRKRAHVLSLEQPTFNLYTNDPSEKFINSIMEYMDVFDKDMIIVKLRRGRETKAKGGDKPAGMLPFGYRYTTDKKHVEVDPDEAAIVREMFSLGREEHTSLRKIAATLNSKGYRSRRGNPWTAASVQVVLRNRFYLGELRYHGETITGNHTPLVSKVQFGKVAAQITRRKR